MTHSVELGESAEREGEDGPSRSERQRRGQTGQELMGHMKGFVFMLSIMETTEGF